jgi:hypothetical protein
LYHALVFFAKYPTIDAQFGVWREKGGKVERLKSGKVGRWECEEVEK